MAPITAVAGKSSTQLKVKRPAWSQVYAGYPKIGAGTASENDLPANEVFTGIFGSGYDQTIYSNACGTRVSMALLTGGMPRVGARKIAISVEQHKFLGKYIEPGAAKLKEFLESKWGSPEQTIKTPVTLSNVEIKLKNKKGIYIMIPKDPNLFGASGHATLWTGHRVIGDHHFISSNTHAVYFWELK